MRRVLSAAVLCAALSSLSTAHAAPSFNALAIKKADLPSAFTQMAAQTIQAPLSINWFPKYTDLRAHGYQLSYTAQFSAFNPKSKLHDPYAVLQESIDRYGNSDGAHWGYGGRLSGHYLQAKTVSLAQVGDESKAYRGVLSVAPSKELAIYFRRGGYVVELHCDGTLAASQKCLSYARMVDRRIKSKG